MLRCPAIHTKNPPACLACFVYLVCLVCLVFLVERHLPDESDKRNKPHQLDRPDQPNEHAPTRQNLRLQGGRSTLVQGLEPNGLFPRLADPSRPTILHRDSPAERDGLAPCRPRTESFATRHSDTLATHAGTERALAARHRSCRDCHPECCGKAAP